ncbi:MAG: pantothenate kinase [Candidatus Methanomethylophilaceae archaeon]|nr:pantothenate kinase [Candidatus Methanomethylophilaceae archaeon]
MIAAFCPGHITCFFHPVRSYDPMQAGSRGVGIKLSKGAKVSLEERSDDKIITIMDGTECDCGITKAAIREIDRTRGYNVIIENDLPVGQGFGMSAAGSLAAALCACEAAGKGIEEAFGAAHRSEIAGGGGYGDVSGIRGRSHVPIRSIAGLPPFGKVINSGLRMKNVTVAVLGTPLNTGDTLSNKETVAKIQEYGSRMVTDFIERSSIELLFDYSKEFSEAIGLETQEMKKALSELRKEGNAGMCMLGHSIFTDLSVKKTKEILGDDVLITECHSVGSLPRIVRKS